MLDRGKSPRATRSDVAFRKWWDSQPPSFRDRADEAVARMSYQQGYVAGRQADLDRYVFVVGRFRITVWATGMQDAKRKAASEADLRAAKNGWKRPVGGWTVKEVTQARQEPARLTEGSGLIGA